VLKWKTNELLNYGAAASELYTSSDDAHNFICFPYIIHVMADIQIHKSKTA
jgi:hypothetical protein